MSKKLLLIGGLLLAGISNAYAGLYMGPLFSYESITSGSAGFQGFTPRLTVGYSSFVKDSFYLAGEVMAGPSTITRNNNANNVGSLKTTYSYGLSVIPGIAFDQSITGYARAGILITHFSSLNTTRAGYQGGVGLQWMFTDSLAARGEYDHVKYTTFSNVTSPGEDQYSVGLIYWFS